LVPDCAEINLVSDTYENSGEVLEVEALPLDAWHRAKGARMVSFAGYHMPIQYDGIIAEHLWTREHAGLFDVSHMGQLDISGEAVDAALEAVLPIDLSTLKPGKQRYSLLLDDNGGVLDDLMVTNAAHHFYLVVNGATKWDDIAHLREHLPDEVTLNHLDQSALLALQGPEAAQALARLDLTPMNDGWPQIGDMVFMDTGPFLWGSLPLRVSRSGYTGEDGFEISVPNDAVEALAEALCAQPEVKPIGLGARDSLRLEAGLPLYGHDLSPDTSPIEAGLLFGINKRRRSEGGFPGAERILREIVEGPLRRWVGLTIEGRQPAREGAEIYAGDNLVGRVTSGGFSPSLQVPIGMGHVLSEYAEPGTALEIDVRGKRLRATVTTMPFVPHRYVRKGKA
jgi:aminomethyltransferase